MTTWCQFDLLAADFIVGGMRTRTRVQSSQGPNSAASHQEGAQAGCELVEMKLEGVWI